MSNILNTIMKQLIDKITDFQDYLNNVDLLSWQSKSADELNKLKVLFADIMNNAEAVHKKQTDALEPFESLINLLSEIVYEIDLSGKFIFMNAYGIEKLGLNKTDIEQGRLNMSAVIHPDDIEKARSSIIDNSTGKRTTGNEYRLLTTSGKQIIVQIFNSPIFAQQKMTGLRGIAIDIGERKKTEEDLRNSVERYKGIFNNSPLAIGYYTKDGILTDCNEKFAAMLGSPQDTLRGFNIFRDLQNNAMLSGLKDSLITGTGSFEGTYHAVLTNRKAPARVLFQGIKDETGSIVGGVALAEDISERVEAEKALKASEKKFRDLVENIGEGAGITDIDNRFVFSNPAANKFFGVEKEGLQNRTLREFMSPMEFDRIIQETNKRKEGFKSTYEIEIVRPDGQTRDLLVTATPNLDENGNYISTLGIFRDITERKKIERELQKAHETLLTNNQELKRAKEKAEESDNLKSAFLRTMNHELRTPLNHIIGLSELIDRSMLIEEIVDFAEEINLSGNNLLSLIDDIFQTIDLEMGDAIPEIVALDLHKLFAEILDNTKTLQLKLKKNHIQILIVHQTENALPNLSTDKNLLKKVFINLIHNALKFTNAGKIVFGINHSTQSEITFFVEDTGIGIPYVKQHLVFERFRQIDQRLKREYGGTGLGLYYSKKIIELLGGKIWFESFAEEGTTFYLTIPQNTI